MVIDINNTTNTYNLLYVDPPWKQSKGGRKRVRPDSSGKPLDYPVLDLCQIRQFLKTAELHTSDNSILFLWTIDKYLFEAE